MDTALTYMFQIYDKLLDFIFNQMTIATGVTVGWVIISVFIISIVLSNILVIPSSVKGKEDNSNG